MHDASSLPETFVAADDVLATHFADEAVILDLRDGVYYGLDAVGARIWSLLKRPISIHDLRDAIVSEFDVPPERCECDIRTLMADLTARGLVTVRTEG